MAASGAFFFRAIDLERNQAAGKLTFVPTLDSTASETEQQLGHDLISTDPEKALHHLAQALTDGCRDLDLFLDLSGLLLKMRKFEEAWKVCELGLRSFHNHPFLLGNQGVACAKLSAFEDALKLFQRQAKLVPKNKRPWGNIASMMGSLGQIDEAISIYRTGLRYEDNDEAHFNLGSALLVKGDLIEGFRELEKRSSLRFGSIPGVPFWDGSGEPTTPLLLYCEQGIGDIVQCARYIAHLNKRGIEPIWGIPENMHRLFSHLPGRYTISGDHNGARAAACQAPIFSLPHFLGTSLESIPKPIPFSIPENLKTHWRKRLLPASGLRVALVWAGNPAHGNDHNRSVPLHLFRSILDHPGIRFASLQMGASASQIRELGLQDRIQDLSPFITDFADTAAILSHVDLLISVDTSVAHLAATQGVPVWMLTPFVPDWRWMLNREDSPWYPSMRLFRQTKPRNWSEVIHRVLEALRDLPAETRRTAELNQQRDESAAACIPVGTDVLLLTSGSSQLASILPKECQCLAVDVVSEELPESTTAEVVVALGILGQIENSQSFLQYLRNLNRAVVVSYSVDRTIGHPFESDSAINSRTLANLVRQIESSGLSVQHLKEVGRSEVVCILAPV